MREGDKLKNSIYQDIKIYDGLQRFTDPIARMMKRYEMKRGSYEYSTWTAGFFDELKWCSNTKDIITPFWRIFTSALVFCSAKYEIYRGKWKAENIRPTYILDVENCIRYRTEYDKRDDKIGLPISKEKLGCKYHEKNTNHYEYIRKTVLLFNGLMELAELTDSMANFSPCPETPFNTLKGVVPDVCDFLNLMIDKIQLCVDANIGIEYEMFDGTVYSADAVQVKKWHKWFVDNIEKYCIGEYYYIDGEKLVGRPMFETQSLNHPLPSTEKEIQQCIESIIRIIKNRGSSIIAICSKNP